MGRTKGLVFQILLGGQLVMEVSVQPSLPPRDVIDCLHTLEDALHAAEREGFRSFGVFNREIDRKVIQVAHV